MLNDIAQTKITEEMLLGVIPSEEENPGRWIPIIEIAKRLPQPHNRYENAVRDLVYKLRQAGILACGVFAYHDATRPVQDALPVTTAKHLQFLRKGWDILSDTEWRELSAIHISLFMTDNGHNYFGHFKKIGIIAEHVVREDDGTIIKKLYRRKPQRIVVYPKMTPFNGRHVDLTKPF